MPSEQSPLGLPHSPVFFQPSNCLFIHSTQNCQIFALFGTVEMVSAPVLHVLEPSLALPLYRTPSPAMCPAHHPFLLIWSAPQIPTYSWNFLQFSQVNRNSCSRFCGPFIEGFFILPHSVYSHQPQEHLKKVWIEINASVKYTWDFEDLVQKTKSNI